MKNYKQNLKRKNAGFTLLELIVVVAVMGLISSMAMDVYTDNTNQKRFELTKQRLAEIKFAIIGDPMMNIDKEPVLRGFYYDMGRLPRNLQELLKPNDEGFPLCIVAYSYENTLTTATSCNNKSGIWIEDDSANWKGPYLQANLVSGSYQEFQDAWGNSGGVNFGWNFYLDKDDTTNLTNGNIFIQSLGLDRTQSSVVSTNLYENDYPSNTTEYNLISYNEVDKLKILKEEKLTGYCLNTTTASVDISIKDQFLCTSDSDYTWISLPSILGYCIDLSAGTIDPSIIDQPSCVDKWIMM